MLGKIANYIEILAKDPRSTVFVSLSECYRQMGLLEDALEVAQKGVATLPNFSPGFSALGRVRAQCGQWEEAASAFEKALEIDSENVAALKGLAKVHLRYGRKQEARDLLHRAAAQKPEDAALKKLLAQLESLPEKKAGDESSSSANSSGEQPIATATIAEIYLRQGHLERAAKVYRDLLRNDPNDADARQKLEEVERQVQEQHASGQRPADEQSHTEAAATGKEDAPFPAVGEGRGADRQIFQLNRWLDAIRKRRDHV